MNVRHYLSETRIDDIFCEQLGLLSEQDEEVLLAHMNRGCEDCTEDWDAVTEVIEILALSVEYAKPEGRVRKELFRRIQPHQPNLPPGLAVSRGLTATWNSTSIPGITTRDLATEPGFRTILMKFEPDATLPAHPHGGVEHLFVVTGSFRSGELELGPGDFQRSESRSVQDAIYSRSGGTVLITTMQARDRTKRSR